MKRIAVTLTTIHLPKVLEPMIEQLSRFPHKEMDVSFIVAGDRKSPPETAAYMDSLKTKTSAPLVYLDIPAQEKLFSKHKRLWAHIPLDSFARRNYADLYAYQEGYDVIVRIDDDNFPTGDDFLAAHSVAGEKASVSSVSASSGWFNVCETLEDKNGARFYPRGYPYAQRWKDGAVTVKKETVNVALNAGLWLGDPDVDAITRLHRPIEAVHFLKEKFGPSFALAKGTWCPINTQNTSYARRAIPAAFVSPHAGRYDDIYSGYFLRAIMDHLGDAVCYGLPLLNQIRNEHNLWNDLDKEMVGNRTCGQVTTLLRDLRFQSKDYAGCFRELTDVLSREIKIETAYFTPILEGMKIWSDLFVSQEVTV